MTGRSREYKKRLKQLFALHYFKSSDIIKCRLLGIDKKENMVLDVDTESYLVIQKIARNSFSSEKTIQACIRAYYLYELLIQKEGFDEWILNEDIKTSLGVSNETLKKIRDVFCYFGFIKVDSSEYVKSIKKRFSRKIVMKDRKPRICPYRYKVGSFIYESMTSACASFRRLSELRGNKMKVGYKLSDTMYKIVEVREGLRACKTAGEICNILLRFSNANILNNNNLNDKNSQEIPSTIYVAPYTSLVLPPDAPCQYVGKGNTIITWLLHHHEDAKLTDSSRLWHPFHSLARVYRHLITYNGSPLIEAMDVHNCFYVLMLKAFELSKSIEEDELKRFSCLVRNGKFYEMFVDELLKDQPVGLYDYKEVREEVKKRLQSYRNIYNEGTLRYEHAVIDNIFKEHFPTIRNYLLRYETIKNSEGKKVKKLQSDMCHLETYLISKLCFMLKSLDVTPFSLHDGIYVSEAEMEQLRNRLKLDSITTTQKWVENLFWQYFDELSPDQVHSIFDVENSYVVK